MRIPGARGLEGHSDADAVAHALTDAILGAAAAGNIGQLFPDSDPQWKDADSMELLRTAHELVRGRGHALVQADLTVITEAPRLGPHLQAMAASLAGKLGPLRGRHQRQGQDERGHGLHREGRGAGRDRGRRAGGTLIEALLQWIASLPPAAVYGVLALLAAIENVVPPVPSDAAVALGAFLSHRGVTTPILVFLVTWTANLLGAALVYLAARRFGHRLFATRTGRRLLAPRSLAVIEREYLRFGVAGIFLSRFLPGIRAVVPPFAGLVRLGPVRTFVPMALASMIWYGGITLMGSLLGAQWQRILAILEDVNRTMGIIAAVLIVVGVAWYLLARRRRGGGAALARHQGRARPRRPVVPRRAPRSRRDPPARRPRCWSWSWPTPTPCSRPTIASWSPGTCETAGVWPRGDRSSSQRPRRSGAPASRPTPTGCGNGSAAPSVSSWWSACGPWRSATEPSGPRRPGS